MFYKPEHALIKKYVQCIWIINHASIPLQTKMLPDGFSDIMINLGGPYTVSYNHNTAEKITGSVLFGQRTKTLRLDQPGDVSMIGIRLHPGKEFAFARKPASSFVDRTLELKELLGAVVNEFEEAAKSTTDDATKIKSTEALLLNYLTSCIDESGDTMDRFMQIIYKAKGVMTIAALLDQTGSTYKQCERLFKKHVGLTPKTYLRIVRFYHTFTQIRASEKVNWTDLLRKYNYYDQSHFIKDYHHFTGVSPGAQLAMKDTLDEVFGFQ